MIKYKTTLGAKHLNIEARMLKEMMQPRLIGMHCRQCKGINTEITFRIVPYTPEAPGNGVMVPVINACCDQFKERLKDKLQIKKNGVKPLAREMGFNTV